MKDTSGRENCRDIKRNSDLSHQTEVPTFSSSVLHSHLPLSSPFVCALHTYRSSLVFTAFTLYWTSPRQSFLRANEHFIKKNHKLFMLALLEMLLLFSVYIYTSADFEEDRQLSAQNRIAQWSHASNTPSYCIDISP